MDLALCKAPFGAALPGFNVLRAAPEAEDPFFPLDRSFPLTAVIPAVSVHFHHSLTDRAACRGCQERSLQAAYLPGGDLSNETHCLVPVYYFDLEGLFIPNRPIHQTDFSLSIRATGSRLSGEYRIAAEQILRWNSSHERHIHALWETSLYHKGDG